MQRTFAAIFIVLSFCPRTVAHDGPPFPIVMDQFVAPCVISVWTDPDIGQGSFFVVTQAPPNRSLPDDLVVKIAVQPKSGRLPEATYAAVREDSGGQVQYKAMVNFDAQEIWQVRVILSSVHGSGETLVFVEPTPDGLGRWDLLIYLLPFLAIGFIWLRAFLFKRRNKTTN
jgi:hypothetical protein